MVVLLKANRTRVSKGLGGTYDRHCHGSNDEHMEHPITVGRNYASGNWQANEISRITNPLTGFADPRCPITSTLGDRFDIRPMLDNKIISIRRPYR